MAQKATTGKPAPLLRLLKQVYCNFLLQVCEPKVVGNATIRTDDKERKTTPTTSDNFPQTSEITGLPGRQEKEKEKLPNALHHVWSIRAVQG